MRRRILPLAIAISMSLAVGVTTTTTAEAASSTSCSSTGFADVSASAPFYKEISWLVAQGISTGWAQPDGTRLFKPFDAIGRDAMAAFLYRYEGSPAYTPPAASPFTDVPTSYPFYKEITWLAARGITTGWDNGDGTRAFRPNASIARDAMAAFLYRDAREPAFTPPATTMFSDVPTNSPFYTEISWLASKSVTNGWDNGDGTRSYRPFDPIGRNAMAAFLYRFAGFPAFSPPPSLTNVTAIAAGGANGYALRCDGTAWAWGDDSYGQLGDGQVSSTVLPHPLEVAGLAGVTAIAAGQQTAFALRSDGTVWSWGRGDYGQLGSGETVSASHALQVRTLTNVLAIAAGAHTGYALRSDGTVWSWGSGEWGALGDGDVADSAVPVQVKGITDAIAIAGGGANGYALRRDGSVVAWGGGHFGLLGNGTNTDSSLPVPVQGLTGVASIAFGYAASIDGAIWAWGPGQFGRLGSGVTTDTSVPIRVEGIASAVAVSGNIYTGYAMNRDGTAWAWGRNDHGQLGDGTAADSDMPVEVRGLASVTSIAAGEFTGYALKSDGTVWAWGNGTYGQIGNGASADAASPMEVGT